MEIEQNLKKIEKIFQEILTNFKKEITKIRSERVSPDILANLKIEYFGSTLLLKQLGTISLRGPREIIIELWDESYLDSVRKAIEKENFGFGIKAEGKIIYLTIPSLTQEDKEKLTKLVKERREDFYQKMRRERDREWSLAQKAQREGKIGEDEKYKIKERLDELIKEYREKLEELAEKKIEQIIA